MTSLLFLAHRIPYPPDKGEKIRAWNIFQHLARTHEMYLGCLADDPADLAHLPYLRTLCADVHCALIDTRAQKLRAILGLRPGRPLTLDYFRNAALQRWVAHTLRDRSIERVFVYCSAMAPYLMSQDLIRRDMTTQDLRRGGANAVPGGMILDMVDIDSEKWGEYAARSRSPTRHVWAREGRTLLGFERRAARYFDHSLFVSRAEAERFIELAPESAERIDWVDNGVDTERFSPARIVPSPYPAGTQAIVFTGTMNYWPNEDAVAWFAREILPILRQRPTAPEFYIVGTNPTPAVRQLADLPGVHVTGRVPDVRPYVLHAAAAVAPLRIARGIQNKVLEAMAMARPVIATPQAFAGVRAMPERELLVAGDAASFAGAVARVLDGGCPGMGQAARDAVLRSYRWSATLARLDGIFPPPGPDAAMPDVLETAPTPTVPKRSEATA